MIPPRPAVKKRSVRRIFVTALLSPAVDAVPAFALAVRREHEPGRVGRPYFLGLALQQTGQRGSGTRRLIDQLLAANGLRPEQIEGWRHEEFTHEAIAATVASGQADAGFGIEAAARKLGLDFVPLTWERYGLAFRAGLAASDAGQRLLAGLQTGDFRRALIRLPGYQVLPPAIPGSWESFLV